MMAERHNVASVTVLDGTKRAMEQERDLEVGVDMGVWHYEGI